MSAPRRDVRTLKHGLARSLRWEGAALDGTSPARVVKRFESAGLLAAKHDAARARREHELLERLHARGLAVPRPLGLERRDGGWEVAMEWIPDAIALQEVLLGRAPWPASPARLATDLGRLLAGLHAAGVDHPDLHPGNVLLGRDGRVWAVDFHKARLAARLSASRLEVHLVRLAAGTRERTARSFRQRFLIAWQRALPAALALERDSIGALAQRVEQRARQERLVTVRKRRLRWTREGSAVRAVALEGGEGFERADGEPGFARALQAALEREGGGATRTLLPCPHDPKRRVLVLRGGAWRALCSTWYCAARLEEHALSAARPLAIARSARPWAAFELPAWGHAPASWDELCGAESLAALGTLAGALQDRGIRLARLEPGDLWTDGRSRMLLALAPRLDQALLDAPARALRPWARALGAGESERTALIAGFQGALGLDDDEREALRVELRHG